MKAGKFWKTGKPRRRLPRRLSTVIGVSFLAAIVVLINIISSRHYTRGDWTRRGVYSISKKAKKVLSHLKKPLAFKLIMSDPGRGKESVYPEIVELLERFSRLSRKVSVERVDIDLLPARAEILAKTHHISRPELREGVVVVASGRRSKVIPRRALASYDRSRGERHLMAFRGEGVLLAAVLAVTRGAPTTVCFTTGHGEASIDSYASRGYGYLADEVRRDGYPVRTLTARDLLAKGKERGALQGRCKVIVIPGPTRAFAAVEVDVLDRYLRGGGHLFLLVGPVLDRGVTRYGKMGLESFCARWGIALPKTILIDPVGIPGEQALMTWATRDGYGDHPIGRVLAGRLTVWPLARELRPVEGSIPGLKVTPLVSTSAKGWAESDLASLKGEHPLTFDAALDRRGPVVVAAAVSRRGPRMVVFGTERGLLNRRLASERVRDFNSDLFLAALAWLSEEMSLVAVGPKIPEHLHLALDDRQLGQTFLITVVALPAMAIFAGLLAWWRRRR